MPAIAGLLTQYFNKQCVGCGGVIPELSEEDQAIMIRVKSLLANLSYVIKDEHKFIVEDYHSLCHKFCSWGE
jgi:hypothetical protein